MSFKVLQRLTNVRSPKDESPMLITTPSKGIIKINSSAALRIGVAVEDYMTIVAAETDKGKGFYLTKGVAPVEANEAAGVEAVDQIGSKLSPSTAGVQGGTLQFSSENAWRELNGNNEKRHYYNIAETPITEDGQEYFELTFDRSEDKQVREKSEEEAEA